METHLTRQWSVQELVDFLLRFEKFDYANRDVVAWDLVGASTNNALYTAARDGKLCALVSWLPVNDHHVHLTYVAYDKSLVSPKEFGEELLYLYNKYFAGKRVTTYRHHKYLDITNSIKRLKEKYEH